MKPVSQFAIIGSPYLDKRLEATCPQCGERVGCFSDGSVLCRSHGWFEPESSDELLFWRRGCFDEMFKITRRDREIARIVSLPQMASSFVTAAILRHAAEDGLNLSVFADAVMRGLDVRAYLQATLLGLDCRSLSRVLRKCSEDWCGIPAVNAAMEALCKPQPASSDTSLMVDLLGLRLQMPDSNPKTLSRTVPKSR